MTTGTQYFQVRIAECARSDFDDLTDKEIEDISTLLYLLSLEKDPTNPKNKDLDVKPISRDVKYGHLWRVKAGPQARINKKLRVVFQILRERRGMYIEVTAWQIKDQLAFGGAIGSIIRVLQAGRRRDAYGTELTGRWKSEGIKGKVPVPVKRGRL